MLDTSTKKEVQEDAKSVIVELRHQRSRKEHLLHEEYNTKHEVSAIPDELCAAAWGISSEPEVQSGQIVYLLLAEAMEWKHGITAIAGLPLSGQYKSLHMSCMKLKSTACSTFRNK